MNIIKRELKANFKSLLIWSGCIIVLIAIMMSEFSAYYDNPEMADVLNAMPKVMLEAFSMSGANLTTVSGFVSIASVYFYIMLGIFAVILGSSIISKEERDKTVEFFMTLPISRQRVITSKGIAAIINCLAITIITGLAVYVTTATYSPDNKFYKFLGLLLLSMFIVQMIFLSIGMLLASIMKRYKKSSSVAVNILLVMYILSIVISLTDKIDFLKYITPFKYFESSYLLNESRLEGVYVLISIGIILISTLGTYIVYPKRDLHI